MNGEPLTVNVNLCFVDILRGSYYTFVKRYWLAVVLLGFPLLLSAIGVLSLLAQGKADVTNGFFWAMIASNLVILLSPFLSARSAFSNHTEENASIYTFDSGFVHRESKAADLRIPWSGIKFARETRKNFLLYTTPRCFLVLPKSSFRGAEEIDRLRNLISQTCKFGRAVLLGRFF